MKNFNLRDPTCVLAAGNLKYVFWLSSYSYWGQGFRGNDRLVCLSERSRAREQTGLQRHKQSGNTSYRAALSKSGMLPPGSRIFDSYSEHQCCLLIIWYEKPWMFFTCLRKMRITNVCKTWSDPSRLKLMFSVIFTTNVKGLHMQQSICHSNDICHTLHRLDENSCVVHAQRRRLTVWTRHCMVSLKVSFNTSWQHERDQNGSMQTLRAVYRYPGWCSASEQRYPAGMEEVGGTDGGMKGKGGGKMRGALEEMEKIWIKEK